MRSPSKALKMPHQTRKILQILWVRLRELTAKLMRTNQFKILLMRKLLSRSSLSLVKSVTRIFSKKNPSRDLMVKTLVNSNMTVSMFPHNMLSLGLTMTVSLKNTLYPTLISNKSIRGSNSNKVSTKGWWWNMVHFFQRWVIFKTSSSSKIIRRCSNKTVELTLILAATCAPNSKEFFPNFSSARGPTDRRKSLCNWEIFSKIFLLISNSPALNVA